MQELKHAQAAHFLTLTYEDDYLDYSPTGEPQLVKEHYQKFIKRLRKHNAKSKHIQKPIRYFTIGEYGETTKRPHYHSIIFNVSENSIAHLDHLWPIGFHQLGTVSIASIHYVTGYLINAYHDYGDRTPPFALHSRKPGLGNTYIHEMAEWHQPTENPEHWRNYTRFNGYKNRLPRYYRDRIFTEREDREVLNYTAVKQFDKDLDKELKRLEKLYPNRRDDIHEVFKERVQHMHDKIKVTKNKNL